MNTHAQPLLRPSFEIVRSINGSKAGLRFRLAVYLLIGDVFALAGSFACVQVVHFGSLLAVDMRFMIGALIPIYVICAFLTRAYSGTVAIDRSRAVGLALWALAISGAILAIVLYSFKIGETVSRLGLGLTFLLSAASISAHRVHLVHYATKRLGGSLTSVVVLCDGTAPSSFGRTPALDTSMFFDPFNPEPVSLDMLAKAIGGADRVVVQCHAERRRAWAHVLKSMNVHAEIVVVDWNDVRPIGIGSYLGLTTMVVASGPLNFRDRIVKRLFDILFSLLVLIVLSPLMIIVAIAIKLDSPGPVLFLQPRIGRQNKIFKVMKFRSMHSDMCDLSGADSTRRNDCRTTRIGRFIRRTSIDEIPQFLNVLKGDMSVVGPRPHAINSTAEEHLFWEIDDRYWHRHACRPGLTGLAQVQGFRGATGCIGDLKGRIDADLQYLQFWSLYNDIKIILRTFRVLYSENAY